MLKNYFITALRHLARNKLYSAINILGFAVGLACCIVIIAFVRGELSYDKFLPDYQRVFRVLATYNDPTPATSASIMGPVGPALAADIPDLESVTRVRDETNAVKRKDVLFYEDVIYADPNFFQTLAFPLVSGDPATAIRDPNTLVISEAMARKYFGDENPVGQVMTFDGNKPMTVSAVMEDVPENSHLKIDFLTNYRSSTYNLGLDELESAWFNGNHFVYVKLKPGVTKEQVEAQLPAFEDRRVPDTTTSAGPVKGGAYLDFALQNFADAHLYSHDYSSIRPEGDINLVYAFAGIALLILLIGSINFVVLTTARSAERAKEIGIRKVMGSSRRALVIQFLMETVLITLLAFVIALSLSDLVLPFVSTYLDRPLANGYSGGLGFFGSELGVVATVGLAAGAYPALVLSALRPTEALKGKLRSGRGRLRTVLVVLQFSISIALVIVTTVMWAQTSFARHVRLGFSADRMIVIGGLWRGAAHDQITPLLTQLRAEPSILSANGNQYAPGDSGYEGRTFRIPGDAGRQTVAMESLSIDYGYLDAYQVRLLAGRMFDRTRPTDLTLMPTDDRPETSANAIITRAALKEFGFATPEDAIGRPLDRVLKENGAITDKTIHYTIIGVVDDFQRRSARNKMNPVVYYIDPDQFWGISVQARPGLEATAMAAIERIWSGLLPNLPVRAAFLDDRFATIYARDERRGAVFAGFAGLALSIACLGLFGLAAFTVDRRTKEIGVRKVMGASTGRIVRLLLWQFSLPVLVANFIAWPLAWYVSREWLSDFRDRIDLNALYFIAAGGVVMGIAWLTVSGHALRVARANPVRALRYE